MNNGVMGPEKTIKKSKLSGCSVCNGLYLMITIGYTVVSFTILIFIHYNSIYNLQIFEGIQNNWKQNFIDDIIITKNSKCPSTHNKVLTQYNWPGTIEGCKCHRGGYDVHKCCFHRADCENDTCPGITVEAKESKKLNVWSVGDRSFTLCGREIPNHSMYDLPKKFEMIDFQQECSPGYKKCGTKSKSESLDVCVRESYKCPIRQIDFIYENGQLIDVEEVEQQQKENDEEQTGYISIGGDFYLKYQRNSNYNPIVEFNISDGSGICLNQNYRDFGERPDYLLANIPRKIQKCTIDTRWQVIDKITEMQFYSANNNFQSYLSDLPDFNVSDYYKNELSYRNALQVSKKCWGYFDENSKLNFVKIQSNLEKIITRTGEIFYIIGALLIYQLLFEGFFSMTHRPGTHYGLVFYNKLKSQHLFSVVKFLGLAMKIGLILAFIVKILIINSEALYIRKACGHMQDMECFTGFNGKDNIMDDYLNYMNSQVLRGSFFTFMLLGWIIVGVLEPNITYWIRRKLMGRNIQDDNDSDDFVIEDNIEVQDMYQLQQKNFIEPKHLMNLMQKENNSNYQNNSECGNNNVTAPTAIIENATTDITNKPDFQMAKQSSNSCEFPSQNVNNNISMTHINFSYEDIR